MTWNWRLAIAGALLMVMAGPVPGRTADGDRPRLTDPNLYLEQRVIIPLRVWDTVDRRFVDSPRWLRPELFHVREDSRRQVVRSVDQEQRPFSIALVVDVSDSMRASLPAVRRAGRHMFDRLKPADQVTLLSFNHEVVVHTDLTDDRRDLNRRLAGLHTTGFTALHDGIDTALDLLEHRPDPRAIVVLTDGVDNRSVRYQEEVLERAYQAGIPLFFIYHKVRQSGFRLLTEAAGYTGGRVFQAENDEDLVHLFGAIADGLRRTILVAYRSGHNPEDQDWRELAVRHELKRFQIHTAKTGYFPDRQDPVSPLLGMRVPLHLPAPSETVVNGPVPRYICPPDIVGPVPEYCPGGLTTRLTADRPPSLEIRGWIDLAHDLGPMLHPARYGDGRPIPDDPRDGEFRDWRFLREYTPAGPLTIRLPRPERLPDGSDGIWDRLLTSGATFRSMGMAAESPDLVTPAIRTTTVEQVPGYAAASGGRNRAPALDLWWPDGGIATHLRKPMTAWLFRLSPDYRLWVRDRYEDATSGIIRTEFEAALKRLPPPVPDRTREQLARYVESSVRSDRRMDWNRIQDGELLPSAHLFVPRRDIPAAEWFNDGDRLLLTRLLDAAPILPESLEQDWLGPARKTWSRLRTFLAPAGHRSLTIGMPFQDRSAGEIYLQRLILPWCDADDRPDCIRFPPPRPEGLELVAELMQRPDVGSRFLDGSFRCIGRCVHTATDYNSDPDSMPPGRRVAWQAVRRERDRLRAIRLELGAVEGAWLYREEEDLQAALEELDDLRVSVVVQLQRSGGDGNGLVVKRTNGGSPWARSMKPVDMRLELGDLASTTDLADLAREHGYSPEDPAIASTLLATRINRTTLPDLRTLIGDGKATICRPGPHFDRVRLLFRTDLIENVHPARIRLWRGERVLVLNLVAAPLDRLRRSLEEACPPPKPESGS